MPHEDVCVAGPGLELAALRPNDPAVLTAPAPTGDDAVAEVVALLETALARAERTIVVLPTTGDDDRLLHVQTAMSLLDTDRVALHVTGLPPLAASVAAAIAASLAPRLGGAGVVAGALPAIERELLVLAWLGTVSGLKHPAPSVAQHARSNLPGSRFAVRVQPDPLVHTIGRDGAAPFAPVSAGTALVMAAGDGGDEGWVTGTALPALGNPPLQQTGATRDAATWWGTGKVVELVGYPVEPEALLPRVVPPDVVACRWCAEPVADSAPCPFCGELNRAVPTGSHAGVGPSGRRS